MAASGRSPSTNSAEQYLLRGLSTSVHLLVDWRSACPGRARCRRRYPRSFYELIAWFPDDEACLRYREQVRCAGIRGSSIASPVSWAGLVGGASRDAPLRGLPAREFGGEGRDDLPRQPTAAAELVHGDLVSGQPEAGRQRARGDNRVPLGQGLPYALCPGPRPRVVSTTTTTTTERGSPERGLAHIAVDGAVAAGVLAYEQEVLRQCRPGRRVAAGISSGSHLQAGKVASVRGERT